MKKHSQSLCTVSMLVMDFDGIHTDGFVYVDENGCETVRCSRRDGLGLEILKNNGIKLCVISKEKNPVVSARCKKLDIEYYQGVDNSLGKKDILESLVMREGFPIESVMYMGDDINDHDAMVYAGIAVTVADGHEQIKNIADIILKSKGGEHAIREIAEMILVAKGIPLDFF